MKSQLEPIAPTYVVGECYRKRPFAAVAVFGRAFNFVRRERPEVIVTTGSLPLAIVCVWVKVFGGKVVWIDSVSQMTTMSMSGSLVRRFADLTLVQWPSIAADHDNVECVGQLL